MPYVRKKCILWETETSLVCCEGLLMKVDVCLLLIQFTKDLTTRKPDSAEQLNTSMSPLLLLFVRTR